MLKYNIVLKPIMKREDGHGFDTRNSISFNKAFKRLSFFNTKDNIFV